MTRLRRALAPVTAIWLFCQVGTLALVPAALWISAADRHAAECTCGHGADAMCPMHHKPTGGSAPCAMQAANSSEAAVLTTLVGMAGLIAEPIRATQPAVPSVGPQAADVQVVGERPVPPDPPPPRA
jgi:hypothetical protein